MTGKQLYHQAARGSLSLRRKDLLDGRGYNMQQVLLQRKSFHFAILRAIHVKLWSAIDHVKIHSCNLLPYTPSEKERGKERGKAR